MIKFEKQLFNNNNNNNKKKKKKKKKMAWHFLMHMLDISILLMQSIRNLQ